LRTRCSLPTTQTVTSQQTIKYIMIELILAVALGIFIGFKTCQTLNLLSFRRIMKDLGITDQQLRDLVKKHGLELPEDTDTAEPELERIEIRIEQHQGVLFAYRLDTDQFLGQGSNKDELIESLKHRLTNVRLIIKEDQGAELLQKNNS